MHFEKPKEDISKGILVIGIALFSMLLIWISWDNINTCCTNVIGFDGAYNAQVARHFAETGKYAVTYPDEIVFYNPITTGPTVLLGTAVLYKFWGISNFTTNFIPVLYGMGVIIVLFFMGVQILRTKFRLVLGTLAIFLYLGFSMWFNGISTNLGGEIGALFYVLLSTMLIIDYFRKNSVRSIILSGVFLAFSVVTKEILVCFVIVFIAMVFWNELIKKGPMSKFLFLPLGFIVGMLIWEIFKFIQLGGNISNWWQWWVDEIVNVKNQTGATELFHGFTWSDLQERFSYLKVVFDTNIAVAILFMCFPLICFICYYFVLKRKNKSAEISGLLSMAFGAESLLIYYILFGSPGLKSSRRLCVYGDLIILFFVFIFMLGVEEMIEKRLKSFWGGIVICMMLFCVVSVGKTFEIRIRSYVHKYTEIAEGNKPIQEMKDKIMNLPPNAQIYTYGWWQAPEVGLVVEYKFKDINKNILNQIKLEGEENYFLAGELLAGPWDWEGSCIEWLRQYYEVTEIFHSPSSKDQEKYTLYRIKELTDNLKN